MVHIKDLPFVTVPASEAKNVLKGKSGFLSFGGDKKKLAKCIEAGKAGMCEVAVSGQYELDVDGLKQNYGVILTKDTRELCAESVVMPVDGEDVYYLIPPEVKGNLSRLAQVTKPPEEAKCLYPLI